MCSGKSKSEYCLKRLLHDIIYIIASRVNISRESYSACFLQMMRFSLPCRSCNVRERILFPGKEELGFVEYVLKCFILMAKI